MNECMKVRFAVIRVYDRRDNEVIVPTGPLLVSRVTEGRLPEAVVSIDATIGEAIETLLHLDVMAPAAKSTLQLVGLRLVRYGTMNMADELTYFRNRFEQPPEDLAQYKNMSTGAFENNLLVLFMRARPVKRGGRAKSRVQDVAELAAGAGEAASTQTKKRGKKKRAKKKHKKHKKRQSVEDVEGEDSD